MMLQFCQTSTTALIAIAVLALTPTQPVIAQEIPPEKLATFAFDVNVERLFEHEYVQALGAERVAEFFDFQSMMPPNGKIENLTRFCGAVQLSTEIDMMAMDSPFEFHFQLHFQTEDQLETIKEELARAFSETVESHGKTYYKQNASNFYILYEGSMLEAGTKLYMLHPDRNFMTERLTKEWNAIPDNVAGKVAIDLNASRDGIESIKAEILGNVPQEIVSEAVLDVVDDIDFGTVYADLEGETLLSLILKTSNEDANKKIKGVADGFLFMVALPLKNLIKMIPVESEMGSKMLLAMADQLKTEKIDGGIGMSVTKPDSFDQIMRSDYLPEVKKLLIDYQVRQDLSEVGRAIRYANNEVFPFLKSGAADWSEELSWRVRVLPRLYRNNTRQLVNQADITESWEHESNQEIIDSMPTHFGTNGRNSNLVWVKSKARGLEDITDNVYQTIALLRLPEATQAVWTNPKGDSISMLAAIKLIRNLNDGESIYAVTYGSSVIKLTNELTHNQLKAYFTPAGGDSPSDIP